ncbi:hypothetical protein RDI58_004475 [Solanum bulbocastanum]|uniref:Protein kinase domain-containing protein n=1 Tax=Solanum bulbocastanum TaxID=147425 RepID=A0AAN8U1S6_SOLBU
MWKRGGTLGKGSYGFVSLAFTDTDSPMNVPSVIAVKSCTLSHSQSLQNERKFLRMFDDCPQIIRCFGFKVTQEDDSHLYNLLLEYASVEVLLIVLEYDLGVDIWALGCTIYKMITGKPLGESSNSKPNFENPKLSTEAKDFLNNCLVKNPSSRWTADMLFNHSVMKIVDMVQLQEFTRKRQKLVQILKAETHNLVQILKAKT